MTMTDYARKTRYKISLSVGVCMKYASFYGDTLVKSVMQNLSRFYTACNPTLSSTLLQGDRI